MEGDSCLLAPVEEEPLQPPSSRSYAMDLGTVPSHRSPPVPPPHPAAQHSGPLAPGSCLLAHVEEEPLLQEATLGLGPLPPHRSPPVPSAYLQALDWNQVGR